MSSRNDLRDAQRAIVAALSQHAAYNYRASSAVVNRINDEIDHLARDLAVALSDRLESLTPSELQAFVQGRYTTSRLKALRAEIDAWSKALDEMIGAEWSKSARDLAGYEAAYVAGLMGRTFDGLPKHTPKTDAVLRKANRTPIMGRFVSDMLSDIAPTQRERIYATIRQGIAAGQSNGEIIRALRGTPALKYRDGLMQAAKRDVERLVRTARNHISNIAYEDAYRALGVTHVVWVATLEGRSCLACAGMDGKTFKVGEAFTKPPLHPNCLPGDSLVLSRHRVTGGSKRWFDGEMIVIKTAGGREFSSTPNHPVLTPRGWVGAGSLNVGGHVVCDGGSEWEAVLNGDHQDVISSIEEKLDAFFGAGKMAPAPVPVSPEHFHGDGGGSKVAVVFSDSLLGNSLNATLSEHGGEGCFHGGVVLPVLGPGIGSGGQIALGPDHTSNSIVSSARKLQSLFRRGATHARKLLFSTITNGDPMRLEDGGDSAARKATLVGNSGRSDAAVVQADDLFLRDASPHHAFVDSLFGPASDVNPVAPEDARNDFVCDPQRGRNAALGFASRIARYYGVFVNCALRLVQGNSVIAEDLPQHVLTDAELAEQISQGNFGPVFLDEIVSVERIKFSGHVYNLETEKGFYSANGIVTHNCRCTLAPSLDGETVGNRPFVRALKVKKRDGTNEFRSIGNMTKRQREEAGLKVGQVKANTTFSSWFGNQDAEFQRQWLGPTRYKLYRQGKYPLERFVDPAGRQYTLEELRQRDAGTFKAIFGE